MARTISEEILTAYVLGELKEADRRKVAALMAKHDAVRRAVSKLEAAVKLTESAFQESQGSSYALTEAQRDTVRDQAEEVLGARLFDESNGLFGRAEESQPVSPFDLQEGIFADVGRRENGEAEGEVFSSVPQETSEEAAPAADSAMPEVHPAFAGKGERHEDSVLFSLKNLQVLAQSTPPARAAVPDDEGSGLIDIRALAKSASLEPPRDSIDPALMGSVGFGPALSAPVVSPAEEPSRSFIRYAMAASVLLVMGITAIMAMLYTGQDEEIVAAQAQIAALEEQLNSRMSNKSPGSQNNEAIEKLRRKLEQVRSRGSAAASAGEDSLAVRKTDQLAMRSPKAKASSKKSRRSRGRTEASMGSVVSDDPESASKSASSAPPAKSHGELDDLLGGATKGRSAAKPSSRTSSSSGPGAAPPKRSLSREDVQRGMSAVAPAVKRCGQGRGGSITVSVKIGKTGRVSSASAMGAHAGTPIGSCAARALRRAKFPASAQNTNVKYPFKL